MYFCATAARARKMIALRCNDVFALNLSSVMGNLYKEPVRSPAVLATRLSKYDFLKVVDNNNNNKIFI